MPSRPQRNLAALHAVVNDERNALRKAPNCRLTRRLSAILYDSIVLIGLLFFAALPPTLLYGEGVTETLPTMLMRLYLLAVAFAFFGGFWTHGGQTIGMRAWNIRVVDMNGNCIGWGRALTRFMSAIVSWLVAGAGFWWSLVDRERLTWHDRLSGTRLVHVPRNGRQGKGN